MYSRKSQFENSLPLLLSKLADKESLLPATREQLQNFSDAITYGASNVNRVADKQVLTRAHHALVNEKADVVSEQKKSSVQAMAERFGGAALNVSAKKVQPKSNDDMVNVSSSFIPSAVPEDGAVRETRTTFISAAALSEVINRFLADINPVARPSQYVVAKPSLLPLISILTDYITVLNQPINQERLNQIQSIIKTLLRAPIGTVVKLSNISFVYRDALLQLPMNYLIPLVDRFSDISVDDLRTSAKELFDLPFKQVISGVKSLKTNILYAAYCAQNSVEQAGKEKITINDLTLRKFFSADLVPAMKALPAICVQHYLSVYCESYLEGQKAKSSISDAGVRRAQSMRNVFTSTHDESWDEKPSPKTSALDLKKFAAVTSFLEKKNNPDEGMKKATEIAIESAKQQKSPEESVLIKVAPPPRPVPLIMDPNGGPPPPPPPPSKALAPKKLAITSLPVSKESTAETLAAETSTAGSAHKMIVSQAPAEAAANMDALRSALEKRRKKAEEQSEDVAKPSAENQLESGVSVAPAAAISSGVANTTESKAVKPVSLKSKFKVRSENVSSSSGRSEAVAAPVSNHVVAETISTQVSTTAPAVVSTQAPVSQSTTTRVATAMQSMPMAQQPALPEKVVIDMQEQPVEIQPIDVQSFMQQHGRKMLLGAIGAVLLMTGLTLLSIYLPPVGALVGFYVGTKVLALASITGVTNTTALTAGLVVVNTSIAAAYSLVALGARLIHSILQPVSTVISISPEPEIAVKPKVFERVERESPAVGAASRPASSQHHDASTRGTAQPWPQPQPEPLLAGSPVHRR